PPPPPPPPARTRGPPGKRRPGRRRGTPPAAAAASPSPRAPPRTRPAAAPPPPPRPGNRTGRSPPAPRTPRGPSPPPPTARAPRPAPSPTRSRSWSEVQLLPDGHRLLPDAGHVAPVERRSEGDGEQPRPERVLHRPARRQRQVAPPQPARVHHRARPRDLERRLPPLPAQVVPAPRRQREHRRPVPLLVQLRLAHPVLVLHPEPPRHPGRQEEVALPRGPPDVRQRHPVVQRRRPRQQVHLPARLLHALVGGGHEGGQLAVLHPPVAVHVRRARQRRPHLVAEHPGPDGAPLVALL